MPLLWGFSAVDEFDAGLGPLDYLEVGTSSAETWILLVATLGMIGYLFWQAWRMGRK